MNVLVIGSGGREHALTWKISQSSNVERLYIAPGNPGTKEAGINIPVSENDFEALKTVVIDRNIDMVVVGPEEPLVNGIYDAFQADERVSSVQFIGPSKHGAQLEGSKDFAKSFMYAHNIPTAQYKTFHADEYEQAVSFLHELQPPYVLKADGLAGGKGVIIHDTIEKAKNELQFMFDGKFGLASKKVVIEEFLQGKELSVIVLTDGKSYQIFPESKDYKRVGEGDTGLNTGGMGAVSPVSFAKDSFKEKVEQTIIKPTIEGLHKDGIDYKGFLYFGLIIVNGEPYVLEFNVRMGDPEAEAIIPRVNTDIVSLFQSVNNNSLSDHSLEITDKAVATVIMVSGGYPLKYEKGKVIHDLDSIKNSLVFHAGTKETDDGALVTNGGRVLAITSYGNIVTEALATSYKNIKQINFDGAFYRRDIGFDL